VHKADRITAALLFASAVAFSAGALKYYPYWGEGGPGSAFLPFWLGVVMAALALIMLLRRSRPAQDWVPRGEGRTRVLVVIGVTIAFVVSLKIPGMVVATDLYIAVLMRYLERHPWWLTAAVAAAAAGVNWLVFAHWLRVPFLVSPLGF